MTQENVEDVLKKYNVVAVVGISKDSVKDSHRVAEYLKNQHFRIIPINPTADEILGEKSYKTLLDTPSEVQRSIEIIDIFRPSSEVLPIIEEAIKLKEKYGTLRVVWMQLGIVNEQAARIAREKGLIVVMNRCMMQEYKKINA